MDTQIFFQKKKKPKYVTILLHVVNSILGNHAQRKEWIAFDKKINKYFK